MAGVLGRKGFSIWLKHAHAKKHKAGSFRCNPRLPAIGFQAHTWYSKYCGCSQKALQKQNVSQGHPQVFCANQTTDFFSSFIARSEFQGLSSS